MDIKDYILTERAFLHDISNQLVITQANSAFLIRALEAKTGELSEKEIQKMDKLQKSVAKIIETLKERKSFITGLQSED